MLNEYLSYLQEDMDPGTKSIVKGITKGVMILGAVGLWRLYEKRKQEKKAAKTPEEKERIDQDMKKIKAKISRTIPPTKEYIIPPQLIG